ncbi:YARHG domain-containing protein [Flavobacterium johnsoniae]|uniref:YARHG domain-containing protein n=1 Tax=Flavobacterium johnsoniae TaxID=986 RepID=UPI0011ECC64C|nr:YARHG domain-containing protein [Flavobacterium johnsoniae]
MKKLLCLLIVITLFSCNKKEKNTNENLFDKTQENELMTELYGSWVGDFVSENQDNDDQEMHVNKINISIKKITHSEVIGRSIVAGNNRPLNGRMTKKGNTVSFVLNEPGDDKNDGVFEFEIKNDTLLVGTWTANNPKKSVRVRSFSLTKKDFRYNPYVMLPNEGMYVDYQNPKVEKVAIMDEEDEAENNNETEIQYENASLYRIASESIVTINSSTQKLTESDLKNLRKIDLEILRNTIFARHGLTFKTKTVRQFLIR